MNEKPHKLSDAIHVLAPTANDVGVAVDVLRKSGLSAYASNSVDDLCECIKNVCGAVIVSEEALSEESVFQLQAALEGQEAWSDLPIIVLTSSSVGRITSNFSKSANITLLERPFSKLTLVSAAEAAIRARKKQYQVRDLLEALKRSKEEAERANIAKSRFLANMSHEIRTPIGAIMGFTDLLKHADSDKEESLSYMGIIQRNSQHLLRLIDDILDLSKVEAGKMTIEKVRFRFTDFLADFTSIMNLKAAEKSILYRTVLETLIPDIICTDPVRLRQILANLVGNAIKFTEKGSVELHVGLYEDILRFTVKDTGIGLTGDQAMKIFQPFAQADTSTTRQFGGTGLGLVLSRRLAEAMGGNLKLVESIPGEGSTFAVKIKPVLLPEARMVDEKALSVDAVDSGPSRPELSLLGLHVLLVEDAPDNQMLIKTYLKRTGADIVTASDGLEGLEAAQKGTFDVVLMDVQMPRMDGHAATRKLRKIGYGKPIIALTAHAMKEERMKCFDSGFTDFLTKPIQPDILIDVLSRYHYSSR